jgi:Zn-dependent M28 family amino/carboxypeptidase
VPEGPGINDNGSGTAAVLEAALQLAKELTQGNHARVRFGFWGAEERGLIGSRHHVAALSEEERKQIALYINLDMVGSTNFVRYVQNSNEAAEGLVAVARRELVADFRDRNHAVEERSGGRYGSDDAAFSQKGVPTVGLYTGAGGAKSEAQAGMFGGTAGRPFDACYHQACDTVDNIDREVLEQNAHALVRALRAIALTDSADSGTVRKTEELPQSKP